MDAKIWQDALSAIDGVSKLITGTEIIEGFPLIMGIVLCMILGYVIWFLANKEP